MEQDESNLDLRAAVQSVCQALDTHARVVLEDRDDVPRVIEAVNALQAAVLAYEAALMESSGWSNPIRHLGRLPLYVSDDIWHASDDLGQESSHSENTTRVRVGVEYTLAVDDEELLGNFVEGRGGDRPSSTLEAVRFLFECDSWDPQQYPPFYIRFLGIDVEIDEVEYRPR